MHRLAIVVPYRNRADHFNEFMSDAIPYFDSTGIDYRVIVVEQDDAAAFNRGMLCNIGFKEAKKLKCDYVVFHDIDMIPIDVDYSYSNHPVHLATDNIPFDTYFGGMTLFPIEDFEKINGFSNLYWGWGYEDDDLRYRCDRHGVNYGTLPKSGHNYSGKTAILNGVDSYIKVENVINFIRDFTIEIDTRLDIQNFDLNKSTDSFTVFNIQGYDFTLAYTSFNKFSLQFFDSKGNYYDIFSHTITNRNNRIKIQYSRDNHCVSMTVNGKLSGKKSMDNKIFNYGRAKNLFIGSDHNLSSFFKGSVDRVVINTFNNTVTFDGNNLNRSKAWKNTSGKPVSTEFIKVEVGEYTLEEIHSNKIPHRRRSKIKRVPHEDAGFVGGRWKSDLTRYNQLRFNNEVLRGDHDHLEDGLSNCNYIKHKSSRLKRISKLKVGI